MKKNWLIIGSVAQRHWFSQSRIPSDIDLLSPVKIIGNQSQVCVVDSQWHEVAQKIIDENTDEVFLSPDALYTMKLSHAHWDVKWTKTMWDINFLQSQGCQKIEWMYLDLLKVWERVHGTKRINLRQSVTDFFNDGVSRLYNHEDLHKLVMFGNCPLHEKLRPHTDSVWCSRELWNLLSEDQKIQTVIEELLVTAIERYKLTVKSRNSEQMIAVNGAYKQLVTSMTKGWFAEYMIMNYHDIFNNRRDICKNQLKLTLMKLQN